VQIEIGFFYVDLAGLDLGNIEHVSMSLSIDREASCIAFTISACSVFKGVSRSRSFIRRSR